MQKVLISACLMGQHVRYNGSYRLSGHPVLERWHSEGRVIALCPEVAAGFATPRPPAEITRDGDGEAVLAGTARVIEDTGRDVTDLYLAAGQIAVDLARQHGCRFAVLTDGSPSCGSTYIYDGSFTGLTKPARGSTAAMLVAAGIEVFPEAALEELDERLRREDEGLQPA